MSDRAIKFQNPIKELNISILDEYLNIFNLYNRGIFVSSVTDCKSRKYKLNERKNIAYTCRFSDKSFNSLTNSCPFNLYLIDTYYKAFAVIKVEKVYRRKKEIPEKLYILIPEQIQDFSAYAYYEFSDFHILPYEMSNSIININTRKPLFDARQVNSTAPWYVESLEGPLANYLINNIAESKNDNKLGYHPNYCVYRFFVNLPNGHQMNYIGMTNDLEERYRHHSSKSSWSSKNEQYKFLYIAFKNVGFENFQFEVLHDNLTEEQAHYWEAKEINNYYAYYPTGFNIRNEDKYLIKEAV